MGFDQFGIGDWYLPSIDELKLIYNNRNSIPGLSGIDYWSSTEFSMSDAYALSMDSGNGYTTGKGYWITYRAIRKF